MLAIYITKELHMYKNFNITESEREEILNGHKKYGYRQPLKEQHEMGNEPHHLDNDYEIHYQDKDNKFIFIVKNKRTDRYGVYDMKSHDWLKSLGKSSGDLNHKSVTYKADFKEVDNDFFLDDNSNAVIVTEYSNLEGVKFYTLQNIGDINNKGRIEVKIMNPMEFKSIEHKLQHDDNNQDTTDRSDRVYEGMNSLNEGQIELLNTFKKLIK